EPQMPTRKGRTIVWSCSRLGHARCDVSTTPGRVHSTTLLQSRIRTYPVFHLGQNLSIDRPANTRCIRELRNSLRDLRLTEEERWNEVVLLPIRRHGEVLHPGGARHRQHRVERGSRVDVGSDRYVVSRGEVADSPHFGEPTDSVYVGLP